MGWVWLILIGAALLFLGGGSIGTGIVEQILDLLSGTT